MLAVSASGRLRKTGKEDLDFEASLDYIQGHCVRTKTGNSKTKYPITKKIIYSGN